MQTNSIFGLRPIPCDNFDTMKAYRITQDKRRPRTVSAAFKYYLPSVECLECCAEWKTWENGFIAFPALKFPFLNKKEFNPKRVVSIEEFNKIAEHLCEAAGRCVSFCPGCGIGELEGDATTRKLDDFTWGTIVAPEISMEARDLLAGEGIELVTAECSITYRKKRIEDRLAVQLEPVALLTEESLIRNNIKHCSRCNHYWQTGCSTVVVPEGYMIKKDLWPKGKHLVQVMETLDILASEEFIEAVEKHALTNIVFEEYGTYV